MPEQKSNGDSILSLDPEHLTPGMKQYQDVKRAHPDCLVMLRMGDFYEMFYEDAITASKELEITLTSRGKGDKRAPLAGVPFHALDGYLGKLVKKGYKVAIVEQLEDPKQAKGLVKRGLVRIVTPGTVIESALLTEKENNYLAAITLQGEKGALAFCDLSTGEFSTCFIEDQLSLASELIRLAPSECLLPLSLQVNAELIQRLKDQGIFYNTMDDYFFRPDVARKLLSDHFHLSRLDAFGLEELPLNIAVTGALLRYLVDTQKNTLNHIQKISLRSNMQSMLLDAATLRNLELLHNLRDGSAKGTLLSILDKTKTAMGARLLRRWIREPLLQQEQIQQRLDAVEELVQSTLAREELRTILHTIQDLERLISRVNCGNATPRDLLALQYSLRQLPMVKDRLHGFQSALLRHSASFEAMEELTGMLRSSIREDAPVTVREGGMIRQEFHPELRELHTLKNHGKEYLQQLEERERKRTGIPSLKLGYNQVFGYYLEVTKKNLPLVPPHFIRKQTTSIGERFVTEELQRQEERILGAEEKIVELEYTLFQQIVGQVAACTNALQDAARKIALLDLLCCLAAVAQENGYSKPELTNNKSIQLWKSRHPVLEQQDQNFIANDIFLNPGEIAIITGPNMSGKSTLQRQVALMVLLAQMGSFIPAERAVLSIVDRIFTRVGAQDDLSSGQSTFMVEMSETANILHNATDDSLIILDEIGRGTSTFDGVALAWSVAEHICHRIRAKTLFSTHYHVLNKLAENFSRIKNYNLAVKEVKGEVIFLRMLMEGATDKSYGIHVAQLAGLPAVVIERAREIQSILEKDDEMVRKIKAKRVEEQTGLERF